MSKLAIALSLTFLLASSAVCATASDTSTLSNAPVVVANIQSNATPDELSGIVKAIEHYIEAGRKGDSKVAAQGFAPAATMSWSENNSLKTVPIKELYDYFDQQPRKASCELASCNVAGDVAMARIESRFDDARFTDMFTLVKDGNVWKIVSKVYHTKK